MSTSSPGRAPAADDSLPRQRRRRGAGKVLGVLVGILLLAAAVLYAVGYLIAGDRMPKDAEISGVAVGGLDRKTAADRLSAEFQERAEEPITVKIKNTTDEVKPAQAGLSIDYSKTVEQAGGGRSLDPRHIWQVLTGGGPTTVVPSVDSRKLDAAVAALAAEHDAAPKDATLKIDGSTPVVTKAKAGVRLDQSPAADKLQRSYLTDSGPVELPAEVAEPEVTDDEVSTVVREFVKPAVAAPITVQAGRAGSMELTPAMIGNALTFQPQNGTLAAALDGAKLFEGAEGALEKIERTKPRDATVRLVDGKPTVIPAVDGTDVSREDLVKAVEPALTKSGTERTVSVELRGAKAKFSTADAEKLGIKEVTGKFTTYFPYASYRNVNISRAAELINQTLLKPGDTFSLNGIVGERTKANGFTEGNIITGGKFRLELGGGVSQSATTTFNAMFFAGLKDIEHQPHTLYIDRYPPGREATVAWPNLDLKFGNDTKYGVLVEAKVVKAKPGKRGSITVRMWSTKTYDKVESSKPKRSNFTSGRSIVDTSPKCQPMSAVPGFDVKYSRLFYSGGKVVKTEKFSWRYAPTDEVRCG